jgi:hypothetical protein
MSVRLLDLVAKRVALRATMTKILDTVVAENRSLTVREEIQFDSASQQLADSDGELENRAILEKMLAEHLTHLLKEKQ